MRVGRRHRGSATDVGLRGTACSSRRRWRGGRRAGRPTFAGPRVGANAGTTPTAHPSASRGRTPAPCAAGDAHAARRRPASPGTARSVRPASHRRPPCWRPATAPRSAPRPASAGGYRNSKPSSGRRSISCSGTSRAPRSAPTSAASIRADSSAKPGGRSAACTLSYASLTRLRTTARSAPSRLTPPCWSTRTTKITAGRSTSGSRLAAPSDNDGGYNGDRRSGRYTVTPRFQASVSSGSPGCTNQPTSAIA